MRPKQNQTGYLAIYPSNADRWQAMDTLVRDYQAFSKAPPNKADPMDRALDREGKAALLDLVKRVNEAMPPKAHKKCDADFSEAQRVLLSAKARYQNVTGVCDRWKDTIRRLCEVVAPSDPNYIATGLRKLVEHVEDSPHVEKDFPKFSAALAPYQFATHALQLHTDLTKAVAANEKLDTLIDAFMAKPGYRQFVEGNNNLKIWLDEAKKGNVALTKILLARLPHIAHDAMKPKLEYAYKGYTLLLAEALSRDVQSKYRGDAGAMIEAHPDDVWLEQIYHYRWALVAGGVAQQIANHINDFRPAPAAAGGTHAARLAGSQKPGTPDFP